VHESNRILGHAGRDGLAERTVAVTIHERFRPRQHVRAEQRRHAVTREGRATSHTVVERAGERVLVGAPVRRVVTAEPFGRDVQHVVEQAFVLAAARLRAQQRLEPEADDLGLPTGIR
jgi:hypothetical protein